MPNKKTRAISREEFDLIIQTIKKGFTAPTGKPVQPDPQTAVVLTLQGNLGLRIGDIIALKLSDIVFESGRYHLDIVEEKTRKARTFTVPTEVYTYLQTYALETGIGPKGRLFTLSVRTIQHRLQQACETLGFVGVSTHSFRKFFAVSIYLNNDYNVELVRELLQHSTVAVTQHYLSVDSKTVENALQKHIALPA